MDKKEINLMFSDISNQESAVINGGKHYKSYRDIFRKFIERYRKVRPIIIYPTFRNPLFRWRLFGSNFSKKH